MRRIIIIIFAVIATMLSFNQKANAQKQVKVPVFEGIITAKKGTVNIRKEASAQSEKIGTLKANITFSPLLDQDDEWYRILLEETEEDSQETDGRVICGYVAKAYCKMTPMNEETNGLSGFVYYLEEKIGCTNTVRKQGDYKQNIIVSGTFGKYYNEVGRCVSRDEGRFMGIPHKGVMVGSYVDKYAIFLDAIKNRYDLEKIDYIYGNMSTDLYDPSFDYDKTLTDEQIARALKLAHNAIMFAVPHTYDSRKEWPNGDSVDNKGIEIMYVDMDNYPFKYETIQFNDDESFSYFVVEDEEEASNDNTQDSGEASNDYTQDSGLTEEIKQSQATIERAEQALKDMEKIQKELYPEPEVTTNTPHLSARLLNVENRGGTLLIDLAVKSDRDKNKLAFSFGTYTEEEGKMDAIKGYSVLIGNKKPAKNEETLVRISIKGKGSLHSLYRAMALLDYNGGKAMINVYNITW